MEIIGGINKSWMLLLNWFSGVSLDVCTFNYARRYSYAADNVARRLLTFYETPIFRK